jgi:BON domain
MIGKRWSWAALLLAAALTGIGCSHAASDTQIATGIKARMFSDFQLKGSSLSVTVKKGVATLRGQVPSVAARYEAFKVASETAGISKVNDEMTVEEPPASSTASKPTTVASGPEPVRAPHSRARERRRAVPQPEPAGAQSASSQPRAVTPAPEAPPPAVAAPSPAPAISANVASAQASSPPLQRFTIPQGTRIDVRMIDSVDSGVNHTGDILHASLAHPIKIGHQVIAPEGTDVYLRLVEVHAAGRFAGKSELRLELYRIEIQGQSYALVSNDYVDKGSSRTKRSLLTILGSSAVGAAIGAIAGGGKGAAIGAAAGGGGGAIYEGSTKSKQVEIPPETLLKFKLEQPASVALTPTVAHPDFRP